MRKVLGQGGRCGGGPAARATEDNAVPALFIASLVERQRRAGLFSKHTLQARHAFAYDSQNAPCGARAKTPLCPIPQPRQPLKSAAPHPSVLTPLLRCLFCLLRRLICFHISQKQITCPKIISLFSAFAGLSPTKAHFFPPKQRWAK